jgi:hypothetical protein
MPYIGRTLITYFSRICLLAILTLLAATLFDTLRWIMHGRNILPVKCPRPKPWRRGLIYLSGASDFSANMLLPNQHRLFSAVASIWNPCASVAKPFPYRVDRTTVDHSHLAAQQWRPHSIPVLIYSLRNFWQFVLATLLAPWYGRWVAQRISAALGPPLTPEPELLVVGNSTGAALILAALPSLRHRWPEVQIHVLMYGGAFVRIPAEPNLSSFHQVIGAEDRWARATVWLPGLIAQMSPGQHYTNAVRKLVYHHLAHTTHHGDRGYFSDLYIDATAEIGQTIAKIITNRRK